MKKVSAGILLYRHNPMLEVFLVHSGGPYFYNKDLGAWGIPKGECDAGENLFQTAVREFSEETGVPLSSASAYIPLSSLQTTATKVTHVWAHQGNCSVDIHSNLFTMEWPPHSGNMQEFPECDKGGWFSIEEAKRKIFRGQIGFLDRLEAVV
jgi:predicted NUDIX family NTP pyrophosphohydrolase